MVHLHCNTAAGRHSTVQHSRFSTTSDAEIRLAADMQAAAPTAVLVSRGEEVHQDTSFTTDEGCLLFSRALKRLDPAPVRDPL